MTTAIVLFFLIAINRVVGKGTVILKSRRRCFVCLFLDGNGNGILLYI